MRDLKKVVIAGAGTMGNSLAQIFAGSGYETTLYNWREPSLARAKDVIARNQENNVKEGEISAADALALIKRISFTCDKECFRDADFMIESIIEDADKKHEFYSDVTKILPADTIITTNTSGLSVNVLSQAVTNPQRFAGMNWWNPPQIIPLVEVIKGDLTTDETCEEILRIAKSVGKEPVLVKQDIKGFLGNRLQLALLREALYLVETGVATPDDVDRVLRYGLGMRYACLGPFETIDLGGIDVFNSIATGLFPDLSNETNGAPLLQKMVDENKLGSKTGQGFYDYRNGRGDEVLQKRDKALKLIAKYVHTLK